jgi:hypothetical protein
MGRWSIGALALTLVAQGAHPQPAPSSVVELWQIVQRQQAEIDALRADLAAATAQLATADERIAQTEQQIEATGEFVERITPSERDTTIGGYGELHYNRIDTEAGATDTADIDYHRFVLFFGHRFNDRIRFASELEIEHSLVGSGAPGEVEIEQAYVDFRLRNELTARAGLFLLPIGILNETHEPPTFYGVERNDVESIIIPSTWWEAGGGISGNFGTGWSWDAAVHSGLEMPTTGSNAFRVRSGRQKVAEAEAENGAYTLRLRYRGIPGLELSGSYQYQADPSQVAGDGLDDGRLFSAHAIYQHDAFALRALYADWSFDGAAVEAAGGADQTGWFVEPSYRLNERFGVYARYVDVEAARLVDRFDQWEAGVNYWPTANVVLKLDYRLREHDEAALAGTDFNAIDLGVGYQF